MEKVKAFFRKVWALVLKCWGWVRIDGLLHAETSFIIAIVLAAFVGLFAIKGVAGAVAVLIAGAVGVGKEVYDYKFPEKHSAEWHDLVCDLVGIAFALLVYWMI